ncbi:MAG: hypothetical protein ACOYOK_05630 [Pseudobdellovibrionaceae bacterium]
MHFRIISFFIVLALVLLFFFKDVGLNNWSAFSSNDISKDHASGLKKENPEGLQDSTDKKDSVNSESTVVDDVEPGVKDNTVVELQHAPTGLRENFKSQIKNLFEKVSSEKSVGRKLDFIATVKERLQATKSATTSRQPEQDEIYTSLTLGALDLLPAKTDFDHKKCDSYKNQMIMQFEPTADEIPTEEAVLEVYKILESLCSQT